MPSRTLRLFMSCWPPCFIFSNCVGLISTICLSPSFSCSNSRFWQWFLSPDLPPDSFSGFLDFWKVFGLLFWLWWWSESAGTTKQHVWSCSKVTNWAANLDLGAPIRSKLNNTQRKLVLLSLRGAESSSDKFGQERQKGLCPTINIFSISRINSWIRLIEQNVKVLILVFFSQYQQLTDSSVQRQAMTSLDKTIFSK